MEKLAQKQRYVYVAGPLFSDSERGFDERIASLCEGLSDSSHVDHCRLVVFLPHRDAGLQDHGNAGAIFDADVAAIERADLIVANLDGADVDAGTAWEIGYAIARGKSTIGIRTDRRWLEPWSRVNLMIEQSVHVVSTLEELRDAIAEFFCLPSPRRPRPTAPTEGFAAPAIALAEYVASMLQPRPPDRDGRAQRPYLPSMDECRDALEELAHAYARARG